MSNVLDRPAAADTNITDEEILHEVMDSVEANDEDIDFGYVEDSEEDEEELMEKTAVSRAMEKLLEDMNHRSESLSSSNEMGSSEVGSSNEVLVESDNEVEDNVFVEHKPLTSRNSKAKADFFTSPPEPLRLDISNVMSKASAGNRSVRSASTNSDKDKSNAELKKQTRKSRSNSDLDKNESVVDKKFMVSGSDFNDTEKSVLRSVQHMSDHSSTGSGDSTLQVLRSVEEFKTPTDDEIAECIQYLDDRFVTQTRGHGERRKKIKKSKPKLSKSKNSEKPKKKIVKSSSSESFNLSTPSHSPRNSSSTSLSEEWNYNKQFVSENTLEHDEKLDEDLLKDYELTLSQMLDEDEMSPNEDGSTQADDLDHTLNAEEASDSLSPKSDYLTPQSEVSNVASPMSPDSEGSVYVTPNSSLTDKTTEPVSIKQSSKLEQRLKHETPVVKKPSTTKALLLTNDRKKKLASRKPLKVIKQDRTPEDDTVPVPFSSDTLIRPQRQLSREGSTEPPNPLERDAWGSRSSSCSSVSECPQNWRPLPPVPVESASSPKQSRSFKPGTGRKLPDTTNMITKNGNQPVAFQSNFMKKAFGSPRSEQKAEMLGKAANSEESKVVESPITTQPQPRALPPRPVELNTNNSAVGDVKNKSTGKTKISVDYSKLHSDHDSGSGEDFLEKRKKIPVDKALKSASKPKLSANRKASPVDNEDIPFADDSGDDKLKIDKFYTPLTSVKPKKLNIDEDIHRDSRKRLLPSPPKEEPSILPVSADHIRDIKKAEIDKAREKARERARLKSDEELGIRDMAFTPGAKYKRAASQESSGPSAAEILSDSDNLIKAKTSVTFTSDLPVNSPTKQDKIKKKKKKSRDRDDSVSNSNENLDEIKKDKDKKKRSLVAMLQVFKTPDKSKELKDKDRSSSTDTLEDKPQKKKKSKTPKSEKKKDKKKRKSESKSSDEMVLSDNLKDLKIGSVFMDGAGKRPGFQGKILPPKASGKIIKSLPADCDSCHLLLRPNKKYLCLG